MVRKEEDDGIRRLLSAEVRRGQSLAATSKPSRSNA